jgi:putative transposase
MLTERIHHALYVEAREREGREASPTAAIIDSQSAKAAQKGAPRLTRKGLMRARRSPGRKRHILVDTLGLLLNVVVHPGDVQDRDGARLVLDRRTRCLFPFIERIFADAGYQGPRVARAAARTGHWVVEIVKDMNCTNSSSCPSAGSSNEPWPGSAAIAAWRAISSDIRAPSPPSSGSP